MPTNPILTVNQDANPFIEVLPQDYLTDTESVRFERESDGRVWTVRGGVNVATGVAVQDFEAPFNTTSSYRIECFDVDGNSLGYTDAAATTIWDDRTIVHQPLDPQLWTTITRLAGTAETVTRPAISDLVLVEGSGLPRAIGSGRQGVTSMPFNMYVDTVEQANALQEMLGSYTVKQLPILVVRTPPPMRVPRTFFMHVPELPERWLTPDRDELFSFDVNGTEVEPPHPGLVVPLLTYDDLDAAYANYDLLDAAFVTYGARDRAYYLAA